MAFVPVGKDLTRIQAKLALGLSKRQLICFSSAAAVGIPLYLGSRGLLGNSTAVILMIIFMLPFFFIAMYEKDGLPAEKAILHYLRAMIWPKKRPYLTNNLYQFLEKEGKSIAFQDAIGKPESTLRRVCIPKSRR